MTLTQEQIGNLTRLRDFLESNKSQMEFATVKNCMADFILDTKMANPVFAKAVWYCMCNCNADRDLLIGKLYEYFVQKHSKDKDEALELVKYALFLGGVDFQPKDVACPVPQSKPNPNTNRNNFGNVSRIGSVTKSPQSKWPLYALIAVAILIVIVILAKSCGGDTDNPIFTKFEICREYSGTIVSDQSKKTCRLSITVSNNSDLNVNVTNIYDPNDRKTYTAILKGGELRMENGPNLTISKTGKGRMRLDYDSKNYGKWSFMSK